MVTFGLLENGYVEQRWSAAPPGLIAVSLILGSDMRAMTPTIGVHHEC